MKIEISYNNRSEIYNEYLKILTNIKFTSREIDVIACILHNRGEKKIAALLLISPRTVGTHIHNIMLKLGHSSKEYIIDFVEKSGKLLYIRQYYLHILIQRLFEDQLIKINKTINRQTIICALSGHDGVSIEDKKMLSQLIEDLKLANIFLKDAAQITENVKENLYVLAANELPQNLADHIILILSENKNIDSNQEGNRYLDFSKGDYYLTVFELLKKIINHASLEKNIQEFKKEYQTIKNSWIGESVALKTVSIPSSFKLKLIIQKPILFYIVLIALTISAIWIVRQNFSTSGAIINQNTISSDLPLPHQSILLKRAILLEKIDKKLSDKEGIQTVVLVGAGGAGKTTIAYQYARSQNQKSQLIWKLNAETKETLITSIKQLAYSISKTEEEKQELTIILQTKDELERERKLFEFLKIKVKNYPNWLIIYNNVETFKDIKEYFPHDSKVWGNGKIIITTRDGNIEHNKHIPSENIIYVGELTQEEKLELFNKIINDCTDCATDTKLENTEFLEKLPPFPFDISLAANYIKIERIPYNKYLKDLLEQKEEFISVQKTILNDIGEYNQTRSDIVRLPIRQLINMHSDFKDLLLFISLIDSENIPKNLLIAYKDDITTSKFIHELKKFSLIICSGLQS